MLSSTGPGEIFYRDVPWLDAAGDRILGAALRRFAGAGLVADRLALTLLVPVRGAAPLGWGHRGDRPIYPASVIKLFYLVAAQAWRAKGRLRAGRELDRALSAMIRRSSNDATNYVIDLLSGAVGGPALPPPAFARWIARRQAVNRYFRSWRWPEFAGINVLQKTWEDGPYGRERQARTRFRRGRNLLTTDATARLLWAIDRGAVVSPAACRAMLALLERRPVGDAVAEGDNQIAGFFGDGLPPGSRLWSKAGWTSETRHDAAIVALPNGRRFILVAFTEGRAQAENAKLLPFLARRAAAELGLRAPENRIDIVRPSTGSG
ncbi:MAG: serine hydrolase [Dongiaceae bacterium]